MGEGSNGEGNEENKKVKVFPSGGKIPDFGSEEGRVRVVVVLRYTEEEDTRRRMPIGKRNMNDIKWVPSNEDAIFVLFLSLPPTLSILVF